ncbi:MAG: hypothetical protein ACFFB5_20490 [Promethearchaeota archaeon]
MKRGKWLGFVFIVLFFLGLLILPTLVDMMDYFSVQRTLKINREASNSLANTLLEKIENTSIVDFLGNDSTKASDNLRFFMNNKTLNNLLAHAYTVKPYGINFKCYVKFTWGVSLVQTNSSLSYINTTALSFLFPHPFDYLGWWQNGTLCSCGSAETGSPVSKGEVNKTSFQTFSSHFYWIFKGKFIYNAMWAPMAGVIERVHQLFLYNRDLDPICLAYYHESYVH